MLDERDVGEMGEMDFGMIVFKTWKTLGGPVPAFLKNDLLRTQLVLAGAPVSLSWALLCHL